MAGNPAFGHDQRSSFEYFETSLGIICLAMMRSVCFPLWLRKVKDLLPESGIDVDGESVRFLRHRFGWIFAAGDASFSKHFSQERSLYRGHHFKADAAANQCCCLCAAHP